MAQLVITLNDAHVARIQDAFTQILGLDEQATSEDVRQYLIRELKASVLDYETQVITPTEVDVS